MEIFKRCSILVSVGVLLSLGVKCEDGTENTRPPPVCPENCVCSNDFAVLRCSNKFSITDHQFASLTSEIHLTQDFTGPILNKTFYHLNGLRLINATDCKVNFIQSGAFSRLTQLRTLILAGNSIQILDESVFKDTIHLEVLDLSRNKLYFLSEDPFRYLSALKVLNVSYNHLATARLGARFQVMTRLEVLDFSGNNIETVTGRDFAAVKQWEADVTRYVNFSNCGLKVIEAEAIDKFPSLAHLGLANNIDLSFENMTEYLAVIRRVQLRSLDISYTNFSGKVNLDDFTVENLGTLTLDELMIAGNGFENIDDNFLSYLALKKLDLSHNKLERLGNGIAKLYRIKHLDLSFNQITTVSDLFRNRSTNLEYLNMANNSLTVSSNLNLDQATKLVTLVLRNNLFESFAIPRQLGNLELLDLSGNKITSINNGEPLIDIVKLRHFDVSNNKLTNIHDFMFRDSSQISYASFSGNVITSVSHQAFVTHCPKVLDLSKNKLQKIHLYGWHNIQEILLNDNRITEIDEQTFFSLQSLKRLDLQRNLVSKLPTNVFAHLSNLTVLDLHENGLSETVPLEEVLKPLGNLQKLDLSYNNFTSLSVEPSPFMHNFELTDFSISNNKVKVFHPRMFVEMEKLQTLDFSRNPFHCACENFPLQNWVKQTTVYVKNQKHLGYICRSPKMRGMETLLTYEVKTFECNRRLFFIVLFSSIGGASMLVAVTLALVCYCVRRSRRGNLDLQSKEESMDLMETDKNGTQDKDEELVTRDEYVKRIRKNYLKGTRSDTLIGVEFENPNLLLDDDVIEKKVQKKIVKRLKEEKKNSMKRKPAQKFHRRSLRQSLDMKKLKYYAHLYDSMRHANKRTNKKTLKDVNKTLKDVKRKDKEKLKKLLGEMDKELKLIDEKRKKKAGGSNRKVMDRRRRPRDNKDLVRMMSMKHSRSMPDVLSYVNSLPRQRYPERDYRHEKVPIYHIDFADPRARHGWVKSMVDIPRAHHKSGDHYDPYRQRYRGDGRVAYKRLVEERESRYGRIPSGYHTIASGNRAHIIQSKSVERIRDGDVRQAGKRYVVDDKLIPNGYGGHRKGEGLSPKVHKETQRCGNQRMSASVDVDETVPKSRLFVREEDEGRGTSSLPAGYHTIAGTRGVTLAPGREIIGETKYHKLDKAKSASTDGHLSQWV